MFVWGSDWDDAMQAEQGGEEAVELVSDAEMGEGAPRWEASELPRDLGADLMPLPAAVAQRHIPKDIRTCTPAALLHAGLLKDHPQLNFPPNLPKRRLTQKGVPDADLGKILGRLQADVNEELLPWRASWKGRRNAYHEYELDCSEMLGVSRLSLRQSTAEHWANASIEVKDRWAFVRAVRERLYNVTRNGVILQRTRIALPEGRQAPQIAPDEQPPLVGGIGKGLGLLRTFNTPWHNEVPELSQIVSENMPLQDKIAALQNLPFLQEKYRQYKEDVRAHARKHGLPSWGCCMEISMHSQEVGRVHLHDYIGPSLDFWGWDEPKRVIQFHDEDRWWNGLRAFTTITKARGNINHRKLRAVAWALYYVSGAKHGSIFSDGRPKPFEELACKSRIIDQSAISLSGITDNGCKIGLCSVQAFLV